MAQFLGSISPKWYQDTSLHVYTRKELWVHLCRALKTVGMVLNTSMSTYSDPTTVTDANFTQDTSPINMVYDYPDAASYTVGPYSYRPCVVVTATRINYDPGAGYTPYDSVTFNHIMIQAARRRSDRSVFTDLASAPGVANNWTSNGGSQIGGGGFFAENLFQPLSSGGMRGAVAFLSNWAQTPTVTFGPIAIQKMIVGNVHVILSSGGLQISVGTNAARKREANNIMAVTFAAHGDRLPDRKLPSINDPYLGYIDPISFIPQYAVYDGGGPAGLGTYFSGPDQINYPLTQTNTPQSFAIGAQHGSVWSAGAVRQYMYSVDNFDRSVFSETVRQGIPLVSPQTIAGQGYHMLDRVFGATWYTWGSNYGGTSTGYVGPITPGISGHPFPLTPWIYTWFYHGIRFSDQSAQGGEFADQDGNHWFLSWLNNNSSGLAIYTEGITKTSTLV